MPPENLREMQRLPWKFKAGPFSTVVPGATPVEGESIPFRNIKVKDGLRSKPAPGIDTIYHLLKYSVEKFGHQIATGARKYIKEYHQEKTIKKTVDGVEIEEKKNWTYFEMGSYSFQTYYEFRQRAMNIGSGLRHLGMEPGQKILLFASTSADWLATSHGAASQSLIFVTAYDSLGQEAIRFSIEKTEVTAVFCDLKLLSNLSKAISGLDHVKHIVYQSPSDFDSEQLESFKSNHPDLTVISIDELVEQGVKHPSDPHPPKGEDTSCIMYTSGSTGVPKGVVIKHSNLIAGVAGVDVVVGQYIGLQDVFIAFLPLAHVLEIILENAVLLWGARLGYATPKTLSDANMRNCSGDIRELRPTIIVGVPAIWEAVRKGVLSKLESAGVLSKTLFWTAFALKDFLISKGLPGVDIIDALVFDKVRQATGGRLRICMNGGGTLSRETQKFITLAFTPLISGYGLTETCAMGAIQDPMAWTTSVLGELPGSIDMKLIDYPEAGYFTASNPPQGEICIRGPSVMEGYLGLEEENRKAFKDGWFCTGDVGQFDELGQIKIIDRKKNLVKILNGEYVALEKLESIYRSVPLVMNICVHASPDRHKPILIACPNEKAVMDLGKSLGIDKPFEELVHDSKINAAVLKQVQDVGRRQGLQGFEIVDDVVLTDEEWTTQNDMLTSGQKLRRRNILSKYQKEVDILCSRQS